MDPTVRLVTSRDVAAAAGVSRSTVSRVLSGVAADRISAETQARVLRLATEMGYTPHAAARQLRLRRANTLGLILPPMSQRFPGTHAFAQFLNSITEVSDKAGYSLLVSPASSPERTVQMFRNRQIDGVLITHPRELDACLDELLRNGAPVVLMNQPMNGREVNWVDFDNVGATRAAVQHLIERDHRRIGCITSEPGFMVAALRLRGYREALERNGLQVRSEFVVSARGPLLASQGAEAMKQLLAFPEPPTAVMCYRDQLAFGALRAIEEAGLRVPGDIAVVGFDDDPASAYQHPPLTTVRADFRATGRAAASMLIDLIEGRGSRGSNVLLPTELIVRQSS